MGKQGHKLARLTAVRVEDVPISDLEVIALSGTLAGEARRGSLDLRDPVGIVAALVLAVGGLGSGGWGLQRRDLER